MARVWVDATALQAGRPPLRVAWEDGSPAWATEVHLAGPARLVYNPDRFDNGRKVLLFAADEDVNLVG